MYDDMMNTVNSNATGQPSVSVSAFLRIFSTVFKSHLSYNKDIEPILFEMKIN